MKLHWLFMRMVIDLPGWMVEMLDRVGRLEKRPRVSLIREAIGEFLKGKSVAGSETAFGVWRQREKGGVKYQSRLRAEWGGW